jgi:protease I
MEQTLAGKKVAVLVNDGFEQTEMTGPKEALDRAGAQTVLVSASGGSTVKGWKEKEWGDEFFVDCPVTSVCAEDYDALLLPGGALNADDLRTSEPAVALVRDFFAQGKPVAAICHAPWVLIEAGAVAGRRVTSWPSLKTDLGNAGARWADEPVIVEDGLVTSRKPDDIPAFSDAFIAEIASGTNRNHLAHAPTESSRTPTASDLDEDEEVPGSLEARRAATGV